jgi:AcrR family transcriptional regulator
MRNSNFGLRRQARAENMAEAKSAERRPARARRRREKEVRPQQIVAAAFEEFAEKGFAGTRLEDVAARARVSKGLPYLYFKTKVELFKAVVRSVISAHFDVMREKMETTELSAEAFLKGPFLRFIQELVGSRRAFIVRLLIAEGHKHPELTEFYYETVVSRGIETLTRLIDRGIARGEFKPTRLRDFPQLLIAPVLTAVIWRSLFERHHHLDTDGLLATNLELIIDAIKAPGLEPGGKGDGQ